MPRPGKPAGLINRAETKAAKRARIDKEASMRPAHGLPKSPPAKLKGHKIAQQAWRRVIRMYGEIQGEVVTRMDMDLLVDYCMLENQVAELDELRSSARQVWEQLEEQRLKLLAEMEFENAARMARAVTEAFKAVVSLDGRVDRKRDLLFKLRQSLYLTPRARAGKPAEAKKVEEAPDELEQLLNDVDDFVNGDQ